MTTRHMVSQAMADYPQAPHPDMVFISLGMYLKAISIFYCLRARAGRNFLSKQVIKTDYESLAHGDLQEVWHMLAMVVFDIVYPLHLDRDQS
uniref:Uncharacterized protein n=1 Tax=Lotus japonicus TaxID=34305 RepID=I3SPE7_LOTJA|nr:unknown [Lotus japonicus]